MISLLCGATVLLDKEVLEVEIADTEEMRAKGLMGRDLLEDGKGMLFVYPEAQKLTFWMKNTKIPLTIAFFDEKLRLFQTLDMDPPTKGHYVYYQSKKPALYALEVPQGWFAKKRIKNNTKLKILK